MRLPGCQREALELSDPLDQTVITDMQNIPARSSRTHVLPKCTRNILQGRSQVRAQNKSQQIQEHSTYVLGILPERRGLALETVNSGKTGKFTKMWRLNKRLQKNPWVKEELKGKSKNISKQIKTETRPQPGRCAEAVLSGVCIAGTAALRGDLRQPSPHLRELGERTN